MAWQALFDAAPDVLTQISVGGAEELLSLTKDRFRTETEPGGRPWEPKKARDGRKTLSGKTSRLKGGWHVKRTASDGFTIAPSVDYATYHQTGTKRMAARKMVPEGHLPAAYSKALEEVATEALSAYFSPDSKPAGGGGIGFVGYKIIGLKRKLNIKALIRRLANAGQE